MDLDGWAGKSVPFQRQTVQSSHSHKPIVSKHTKPKPKENNEQMSTLNLMASHRRNRTRPNLNGSSKQQHIVDKKKTNNSDSNKSLKTSWRHLLKPQSQKRTSDRRWRATMHVWWQTQCPNRGGQSNGSSLRFLASLFMWIL